VTIYLLETTLTLALALLASRLPRLAARTRYAIVFAALLKCALPSELITYAMSHYGMAPAKGLIALTAFGVASSALPAGEISHAQHWLTQALLALWLLIAASLILNAFVCAATARRSALIDTEPPLPREHAALDQAKARVGLTRSITILRSPFAAAPATIGVRRPVILLPLDGCDALDDDELAAILMHECAHVRRRDNLLGLIEIIVSGVLWFHPLVWLARRTLAETREVACDEAALGAAAPETYLNALTKLARGVIAAPLPSVSCMAASNLKERMRHIMQFRPSRLASHRLVTTAAAIFLAAFTLTAGAVRAAGGSEPAQSAYTMQYTIEIIGTDANGADRLLIAAQVLDPAGKVVKTPRVSTNSHTSASIRTDPDAGGTSFWMEFNGTAGTFRVLKDGTVVSETAVTGRVLPPKHLNTGIDLDLAGADFRDVMKTFGQLANVKIDVEPGVDSTVTVSLRNTPWEDALRKIVTDAGLQMHREGNTIHVTK
jgi:beta-lactamase regulating signal transducer with metallopeptidase domain